MTRLGPAICCLVTLLSTAPAVAQTPPATARNETSIEELTRLRAQRQGTRVVPRGERFPHAPDDRPVMTLERMWWAIAPPLVICAHPPQRKPRRPTPDKRSPQIEIIAESP